MLFQAMFHALGISTYPRSRRNQLDANARRGERRWLLVEGLEDRRLLAFVGPVDYVSGTHPQVADFNNDGRLDLATMTRAADNTLTVSVALNNGDGTFQQPLVSATGVGSSDSSGPEPQSVAVGDFNTDGKLDLALSVFDSYGVDNDVRILLGNGDGTFAAGAPVTVTQGYTSNSVVSGDLDSDGKMDLVVTSDEPYGLGGQSVSVRLGRGDGTFAWSATYEVLDNQPFGEGALDVYSPVLADFDGDGNVDVALPGGEYKLAYVKLYLGNGDGTLSQPTNAISYPSMHFAVVYSVFADDFNADGRPDLVADGEVYLGNGAGTFQSAGFVANAKFADDVNGDGQLDLVAPSGADLNVYLGNGDGSFAPPITTPTEAAHLFDVLLADFNGDGRPDAAVNDWGTVSVMLNDGEWMQSTLPSIRINDVTITEGNTGTVQANFTVTLSASPDQPVTVQYTTLDGTATAGADYQVAVGTLIFNPGGPLTQTITVVINGDLRDEWDEEFYVNLSATDAVLFDAEGRGTIVDNDPAPSLTIQDRSLAEGRSGTQAMLFTVTLSAPSEKDVSVVYRTANGSALTSDGDYGSTSGIVTFAPGETSKTFSVSIFGDARKEKNEEFYVNLSSASNAVIADSQAVGTILNDDSSPVKGKPAQQTSDAAAFDAAILDLLSDSSTKKRRVG